MKDSEVEAVARGTVRRLEDLASDHGRRHDGGACSGQHYARLLLADYRAALDQARKP
jgi:bacterioferritin-associated ferredoxin